jgi:hypothetical protein
MGYFGAQRDFLLKFAAAGKAASCERMRRPASNRRCRTRVVQGRIDNMWQIRDKLGDATQADTL